jgi:hypothetical protein
MVDRYQNLKGHSASLFSTGEISYNKSRQQVPLHTSTHFTKPHSITSQNTIIVYMLCIFSVLTFVNKNRDLFQSNSEIHDINTHYTYNLHLPSTNLTLVQKGVPYSGSKIYNHLPLSIKILSNDDKNFKSTLIPN